jgi:hypothetical protein
MHEFTRSLKSSSSLLFAFLYEAAATRTVAPSALARCASVLALGFSMTNCVPAKSYDEARTAAETEFTAHGRTRSRLEAAHERIRTLEQTLADRERALESGESAVAEAKLETVVTSKDKEAAILLVEQLRSELARTGNHLAVYSDEKRQLAQALILAEERVRAIEAAEKNLGELVATARDLGLVLGPELEKNGITVGADKGEIVLYVPAGKLFAENSDSLVVDAAPVLGAVSRVATDHPKVRVGLRAPDKASLSDQRIQRLGAALRDRGIPDARLVLPSAPPPSIEPTAAPVATDPAPSGAPEAAVSPADSAPPSPEATAAPTDENVKLPAAQPAPVADPNARYEIRFGI